MILKAILFFGTTVIVAVITFVIIVVQREKRTSRKMARQADKVLASLYDPHAPWLPWRPIYGKDSTSFMSSSLGAEDSSPEVYRPPAKPPKPSPEAFPQDQPSYDDEAASFESRSSVAERSKPKTTHED